MRALLPMLLLFAVAGHGAHLAALATPLPTSELLEETLPTAKALDIISLGYNEVMADYYWLRAINHFGDKAMHGVHYPNLAALLKRVLALDPYFGSAYVFAGTTLTIKGVDNGAAMDLLRQGIKHRPDLWKVPFLLGFNLYYFEKNYIEAASMLSRAAVIEGAPEYTGLLATRLAAEGGDPKLGLHLLDTLRQATSDPDLLKELDYRAKVLTLEIHLEQLNMMADVFAEKRGHRPKDIGELLRHGYLKTKPIDPLGAPYAVGQDGRIHSKNEGQRLRLKPEAINDGATP